MKDKWKNLGLILFSVLLVDSGQLLLKWSLNNLGEINWGLEFLFHNFFIIVFNPFIWLAGILMVSAAFTWLLALSKSTLSYAYPILSVGYVIVSILSWFLFGEPLGMIKAIGLGIIAVGVVMLSHT
jgi:drug/metabolite transporter (DMT)-like permease